MVEILKNYTKKIDQLNHRFMMMKTYLMKMNKKVFVSAFITKNENVSISQSQTDNEKTFVFVAVKMMNDSMKKKISTKWIYFSKNLLYQLINIIQIVFV